MVLGRHFRSGTEVAVILAVARGTAGLVSLYFLIFSAPYGIFIALLWWYTSNLWSNQFTGVFYSCRLTDSRRFMPIHGSGNGGGDTGGGGSSSGTGALIWWDNTRLMIARYYEEARVAIELRNRRSDPPDGDTA